jgi:MSHA biogenesis protein MshP
MQRAQRGFSLVSAIFLLVVLAALGAAMVTFSTAQNQSLAMDVLGSRAYQAANAGIEWAAYRIESGPGGSFGPATVFVPGATPLGGKLEPFTVTVGYAASSVSDEIIAGSGIQPGLTSYYITASAVYGVVGTTDYVERVVNAKMLQ